MRSRSGSSSTARRLLAVALLAVVASCGVAHGAVPGRSLQQAASTPAAQSIYDKLNVFMQNMCNTLSYPAPKGCQIDFNGTSDWWRQRFLQYPPLNISAGIEPPVITGTPVVSANKTIGTQFCPWRPFPYVCQLDEQSYKQSVSTQTNSYAWNVGGTVRTTALVGGKFLGAGFMAGYTAAFSFAYNFGDSSASAETKQSTTVNSLQLKVDPKVNSCVLMTTHMTTVQANATQNAYVAVSGFIGTKQDAPTNWLLWDANGPTQYRAFWFPYAVQFMLRTNQLGPRDSVDGFFVETNGLEARFKVPIQLQFDVGTTGYTDVQSQPKDSDFCKAHDSQQARRRMLGVAATPAAYGDEVLEHKLVDGELLPVIRAAPMRM